jgi:hypothetical protein
MEIEFTFDVPEDDVSGVQGHEQVVVTPNGGGNPLHPGGYTAHVVGSNPESSQIREVGTAVGAFETAEEMTAALSARLPDGRLRMAVDEIYRAAVEARVAQAMGASDSMFPVMEFRGAEPQAGFKGTETLTESLQVKTSSPEGPAPFECEMDMVDAMTDPRYRNNPSYRRMVDARVAAGM